MCVEMVVLCKKPLDKKSGCDHVASSISSLNPIPAQTMSRGPALFSCKLSESSRWRLPAQPEPASDPALTPDRLWDGRLLQSGPGLCPSLSSLLRDLNLSPGPDPGSTAPPNKRRCRTPSSCDDPGHSPWRPQGSRIWTTVVKRRCHSGSSVHRPAPAQAFPPIKRSSSLGFPGTSCSPSSLGLGFPGTSCSLSSPSLGLGFPGTSCSLSSSSLGLPGTSCSPSSSSSSSPPSSADSTPGADRRRGRGDRLGSGLARSRSHPCVSHEKKAGVKRRRPEEAGLRPSLDLTKMTQKLRSFHSLSRPGVPPEQLSETSRSCSGDSPGAGLCSRTSESAGNPDCSDTLSSNQERGDAMWAGQCGLHQLGGELDIEQIERN